MSIVWLQKSHPARDSQCCCKINLLLPGACQDIYLSNMDIEHLRYPTGKYIFPQVVNQAQINAWVDTIEAFPARIRNLVESLSNQRLEARYREGGWTIRQVVHHVADSHLNSYIRFKWTLTEDRPTIKTYDQEAWGKRPDAVQGDVAMSLKLLEGLHERWVYVLRGLTEEERSRKFFHPEKQMELDLNWLIGLYAWHCNHHAAHIELALNSPA